MKLKEIKPGMVIHCKTQEEKIALLEEADRLGYKWNNNCVPTDCRMIEDSGMTIHFHGKTVWMDFKSITWSDKTESVIEFSDLIIPEMSVEEAFSIYKDICKHYFSCEECPLSNPAYTNCGMFIRDNSEKAIDIMGKWKSDHEKKEPESETEWFWQGKILKNIEGVGYCQITNGTGIYDTGCEYRESAEEYMAEELKEYCKMHDGEFIAVVEHVCRVKAVE